MDRQTFVAALTAGGIAGGLSGCLGVLDSDDDGSVPDPVDLSGDKVDDEGGMQIGPHGGRTIGFDDIDRQLVAPIRQERA